MANKRKKKPVDSLDFQKMRDELKGYDPSWVEEVVKRMMEDTDVPENFKTPAITPATIYNVLNFIKRNGQWRLHTYRVMKDYRDALKLKFDEVAS